MKTKIIALVVVAVFLGSLFAGTAWAEESGKVENKKSYKSRFIFKWLKLFFRVLKLEWKVSLLQKSVRKLNSDLDRETFERQSGDRRLKLIIDDEAKTREEDDIALGEEIDREAAAREQGDERLANALADEKAERQDADKDLQEQIDSIETGATNVPIFFSSGADLAEPVTIYRMGLGQLTPPSENVGLFGIVTPLSGTITNLYGYSLAKPTAPTDESILFQLLVNNALTKLQCDSGPENCTNQDISVPVKAGDTLTMLVFASSGIKATKVGASVVLEGTGTKDLNKLVLHE